VDGVTAKVAEEVAVLFEHDHLDPGAGKQQTQHDPGRASADHAAVDTQNRAIVLHRPLSYEARTYSLMVRPRRDAV